MITVKVDATSERVEIVIGGETRVSMDAGTADRVANMLGPAAFSLRQVTAERHRREVQPLFSTPPVPA